MIVYVVNRFLGGPCFAATSKAEVRRWMRKNHMKKYGRTSDWMCIKGRLYWLAKYDTEKDVWIIYNLIRAGFEKIGFENIG
jgi:hypothetical protein